MEKEASKAAKEKAKRGLKRKDALDAEVVNEIAQSPWPLIHGST